MGKMGVACRAAVPAMPVRLFDQRQVLARHDGLAGHRVPEVMQAQSAKLRVVVDRTPASDNVVRGPSPCVLREQEGIRSRGPESASTTAHAASPRGTARGPVFAWRKLMASLSISRQRRLSTSMRRHPVSASNRIAATASGNSALRVSSARPSPTSSSASRNRATWLRGFFAMPRQRLSPRPRGCPRAFRGRCGGPRQAPSRRAARYGRHGVARGRGRADGRLGARPGRSARSARRGSGQGLRGGGRAECRNLPGGAGAGHAIREGRGEDAGADGAGRGLP